METIDWENLKDVACEVMQHAYAPYSGYPVGAAAIVDDGRIVSGCNVENAAYGVGLCAECGMVSELTKGGGGRLVAFVAVNGNREVIVPCGRCRQLLFEHGGKALKVLMPHGVMTMDEVLPYGFGPTELNEVESAVKVDMPYALQENVQ
ncbi:cytidine deaminase [Arcanobacterium bovis]|uniref:Cytidine deaminase n=1 Tax=Arcanobacterium bovis TaxID=2529275 RepID=A0A4Q9V279_9ACTO|nr:cytidine deaminase [Arcanobacterium bovis]TBW22145.1 cytidine deaminase [Arcanobacterium bovis]